MTFRCPAMEDMARNRAAMMVIDDIARDMKKDFECVCEYVPPQPRRGRCTCENCECPCMPPKPMASPKMEPPPVMVCYKMPKKKTPRVTDIFVLPIGGANGAKGPQSQKKKEVAFQGNGGGMPMGGGGPMGTDGGRGNGNGNGNYAADGGSSAKQAGKAPGDQSAKPTSKGMSFGAPTLAPPTSASADGGGAGGEEGVIRLGQSKSRELRGGVMYVGCDCEKRNGLQDDCQRTECHGSPACLTRPYPTCGPSEFANAKHMEKVWGPRALARQNARHEQQKAQLGGAAGIVSEAEKVAAAVAATIAVGEMAAAVGLGGGAGGGGGLDLGLEPPELDYEYHCFPATIKPAENEGCCCSCK